MSVYDLSKNFIHNNHTAAYTQSLQNIHIVSYSFILNHILYIFIVTDFLVTSVESFSLQKACNYSDQVYAHQSIQLILTSDQDCIHIKVLSQIFYFYQVCIHFKSLKLDFHLPRHYYKKGVMNVGSIFENECTLLYLSFSIQYFSCSIYWQLTSHPLQEMGCTQCLTDFFLTTLSFP